MVSYVDAQEKLDKEVSKEVNKVWTPFPSSIFASRSQSLHVESNAYLFLMSFDRQVQKNLEGKLHAQTERIDLLVASVILLGISHIALVILVWVTSR